MQLVLLMFQQSQSRSLLSRHLDRFNNHGKDGVPGPSPGGGSRIIQAPQDPCGAFLLTVFLQISQFIFNFPQFPQYLIFVAETRRPMVFKCVDPPAERVKE